MRSVLHISHPLKDYWEFREQGKNCTQTAPPKRRLGKAKSLHPLIGLTWISWRIIAGLVAYMSTFNVSCLCHECERSCPGLSKLAVVSLRIFHSLMDNTWQSFDFQISKIRRHFPISWFEEQDQLVTYSGKDNREFLVGGGFVVTVWARSSVSCCFKLSTKERCFPQRCRAQIKEPRKALHLVVLHQCLPVPHSSNCPLFAALSLRLTDGFRNRQKAKGVEKQSKWRRDWVFDFDFGSYNFDKGEKCRGCVGWCWMWTLFSKLKCNVIPGTSNGFQPRWCDWHQQCSFCFGFS